MSGDFDSGQCSELSLPPTYADRFRPTRGDKIILIVGDEQARGYTRARRVLHAESGSIDALRDRIRRPDYRRDLRQDQTLEKTL